MKGQSFRRKRWQALVRLERLAGEGDAATQQEIDIDAQCLNEAERTFLFALLSMSDFYRLPSDFHPPEDAAAPRCILTVKGADREGRVRFSAGDGHPPELDVLVNWLLLRGRSAS